MTGTGTRWRRVGGRIRATAVVAAIVAASLIGLHDWADGAATHEAAAKGGTGEVAAER